MGVWDWAGGSSQGVNSKIRAAKRWQDAPTRQRTVSTLSTSDHTEDFRTRIFRKSIRVGVVEAAPPRECRTLTPSTPSVPMIPNVVQSCGGMSYFRCWASMFERFLFPFNTSDRQHPRALKLIAQTQRWQETRRVSYSLSVLCKTQQRHEHVRLCLPSETRRPEQELFGPPTRKWALKTGTRTMLHRSLQRSPADLAQT